jgi:membrane peptidoglycan carboxypeptidase
MHRRRRPIIDKRRYKKHHIRERYIVDKQGIEQQQSNVIERKLLSVHLITKHNPLKRISQVAKHREKYQHTYKRSIGRTFLGVVTIFAGSLVSLTVFVALLVIGYLGIVNQSIPDVTNIVSNSLAQSTKIYDRNGRLLYTVYDDVNREYVELKTIPQKTIWALLAAEDIDYYQHSGVDFQSMLVILTEYLQGNKLRGGSTLTQQFARNVILTEIIGEQEAYDRSLKRKVAEMLAAFKLEKAYSKDTILELQMNEVFLGGTTYGFQTGARAYFSKDISSLTIAESAFLAGIIHAPSYYFNAISNGDIQIAVDRRNTVLDLMLKHSDKTKVTKEEIEKAKAEKLVIKSGKVKINAPHFVFYVKEQLEKMYGKDIVQSGGLKVTTTLDLKTQSSVEGTLRYHIKNFKTWYGVNNGAVVVIDPRSGEVLSMVGSVDYNNTKDRRVDGNVNVAVMPRQMGSSVKPYTYMLAFSHGYTPNSAANDTYFKQGNYVPKNWDNKYYGGMTIRTALNQSRNVPAVALLAKLGGAPAFVKEAKKLGITTLTKPQNYGLSITLGAAEMKLLEHTNAFAVFASGGIRHSPTVILKVEDAKGNVLYKYDKKKDEKRIYSVQQTYQMNWILCMYGGRLDKHQPQLYNVPGQRICGKTGTTTGPKDLLTVAYYPRLVVGVWAGNNNGKFTFGTRGQGWSENVPLVIAHDVMANLVPRYGREMYYQPKGTNLGSPPKAKPKTTTVQTPKVE